jgi:hypothetical protein
LRLYSIEIPDFFLRAKWGKKQELKEINCQISLLDTDSSKAYEPKTEQLEMKVYTLNMSVYVFTYQEWNLRYV